MPRVRPRCVFLYLVSVLGCFCVIFNVHQVYYSFPILPPPPTHAGQGKLSDNSNFDKLLRKYGKC